MTDATTPHDAGNRAELIACRQRAEALAVALAELFDYTVRLEGASSAWFITRSRAKRPDVAPDLGDRIKALLGGRSPRRTGPRGRGNR